jgi:hypothetical protein
MQPTCLPTCQPSSVPSSSPISCPSLNPSNQPTGQPSTFPSSYPTTQPSEYPSRQPSSFPASQPSYQPSGQPSSVPSTQPASLPTMILSSRPSSCPSTNPSTQPTGQPSIAPSARPNSQPSSVPSAQPTSGAFLLTSSQPTSQPSSETSSFPLTQPATLPTSIPSSQLPCIPTLPPSSCPSNRPSTQPTEQPLTVMPASPSLPYSPVPSTQAPSAFSEQPTSAPSGFPTAQPSSFPTSQPSTVPSEQPSSQPSSLPSSQPSSFPSVQPSSFTSSQSTDVPTSQPSALPTGIPTTQPFSIPSSQPTSHPSPITSKKPTSYPIFLSTPQPFEQPTPLPTEVLSSRPTRQPSSHPSSRPAGQPTRQPVARPSSDPSSPQPTATPFVQSSPSTDSNNKHAARTSSPTFAPTALLSVLSSNNPQTFRGSLFILGASTSQSEILVKDINLNDVVSRHSASIVFGQKKRLTRNLDLQFSSSFSAKTSPSLLSRDSSGSVRSTAIVGDINGDGYRDLVIGYPFSSLAVIYKGKEQGFVNLVTSFLIYGEADSEFGWAVNGLGDINGDHYNDFIISAKAIGVIYVLFGRSSIMNKNIDVTKLTTTQGFKIIGASNTFNTGVAVAGAGDFNKDGFKDIMFSAMTEASQGIVYILLGTNSFRDTDVNELLSSSSTGSLLIITCPSSSFSGLSITGIGDIDNDGFDDIAIGSLPYKGGYRTQKTYLIYGRKTLKNNKLSVTELAEGIDGITITGGGFMVAGPGDLNNDGIADLLIFDYPFWQGQSSGYFIQFPENVTSPPTVLPSSFPSSEPSSSPSLLPTIMTTSEIPSNLPTTWLSSSPTALTQNFSSSFTPTTFRPTLPPKSLRPTRLPTVINSLAPTRLPTRLPSSSPLPTYTPTQLPTAFPISPNTDMPTVDFRRLRGSSVPSLTPTQMTVNNITTHLVVDCTKAGEYHGKNESNYKFSISANSGTVTITGNAKAGVENVYDLQTCPIEPVDVVLKNFRLSTDVISVMKLLNSDGYVYPSMNEISYSAKAGQPLTLLFCAEHKLQVILSTHDSFDLTGKNFLFAHLRQTSKQLKYTKDTIIKQIQIGIALAVLAVLFLCLWVAKVTRELPKISSYSDENESESEDVTDLEKEDNNDCVSSSLSHSPFSLISEHRDESASSSSKSEDDEESGDSLNSSVPAESVKSGFTALMSKWNDNDHDICNEKQVESDVDTEHQDSWKMSSLSNEIDFENDGGDNGTSTPNSPSISRLFDGWEQSNSSSNQMGSEVGVI